MTVTFEKSERDQRQLIRVKCPHCGNGMCFVYADTVLNQFPAYCRRCKTEYIVNAAPAPERQR